MSHFGFVLLNKMPEEAGNRVILAEDNPRTRVLANCRVRCILYLHLDIDISFLMNFEEADCLFESQILG
jgi:hypothetical protein